MSTVEKLSGAGHRLETLYHQIHVAQIGLLTLRHQTREAEIRLMVLRDELRAAKRGRPEPL